MPRGSKLIIIIIRKKTSCKRSIFHTLPVFIGDMIGNMFTYLGLILEIPIIRELKLKILTCSMKKAVKNLTSNSFFLQEAMLMEYGYAKSGKQKFTLRKSMKIIFSIILFILLLLFCSNGEDESLLFRRANWELKFQKYARILDDIQTDVKM